MVLEYFCELRQSITADDVSQSELNINDVTRWFCGDDKAFVDSANSLS